MSFFTTVSIRNLIAGGRQTLLSIVGIGFAIILIFMQLGFLGAVLDTAVLFYNNLNFDLIACSPDYYHFADSKDFPRSYLKQMENVAGVQAVYPYHVSLARWSYAEKSLQRGMLLMGVDADVPTFNNRNPKIELPDVSLLVDDRSIIVDQKSRPEFLGFENSRRFSEEDIGLRIELNQYECEIRGLFQMGTGLAANGAAIINERGFARLYPAYGADRVALGLIQLEAGDSADLAAVRDAIERSFNRFSNSSNRTPLTPANEGAQSALPPVEIFTRREVVNRERMHWVTNTPVGFIFLTGVVMSFIVGAIVVYIVLSADINRQFREYATLKAMGYRNTFLFRIVLEQALILGISSYAISFAVSVGLYKIIGDAANLPINMSLNRQGVVFSSTMAMCCVSALIAMQKLRKADPADLF